MVDNAATATQCAAHSMQRALTTKPRSNTGDKKNAPCSARVSNTDAVVSRNALKNGRACRSAAGDLELAKLIAGENKEQLDVVEEEVDLQAAAA
jgi:hypothetical protein